MSAAFSQGCCYDSPHTKELTHLSVPEENKAKTDQSQDHLQQQPRPPPVHKQIKEEDPQVINNSGFSVSVHWLSLLPSAPYTASADPVGCRTLSRNTVSLLSCCKKDLLLWMLAPPDESHSPFHTCHGMSPIFQSHLDAWWLMWRGAKETGQCSQIPKFHIQAKIREEAQGMSPNGHLSVCSLFN